MQAIVAVSQNWGIGKDGNLLFHIKEDMQRFKALTMGHTVIMGRKTLESLPGKKGLPGRHNIVLTSDENFFAENAEVVHDISDVPHIAESDAFCIGGGHTYRELLPCCDKVFVTKIFSQADADAYFPNLDEDPEWEIEDQSSIMVSENGLRYSFVNYGRK